MLFFGKSDIGKKRKTNQDNFITKEIYDNAILCVVCDGMGGANGGSIASDLAITFFADKITDYILQKIDVETKKINIDFEDIPALLAHAVVAANDAVYKKSIEQKELAGMGTTLVAALIINSLLYIVNIGDSRLYLLSKDSIAQITHDHSYVQYLVDLGKLSSKEAESYPNKNIITRAIGIDNDIEADMFSVDLKDSKSGYILLCSDGLSNFLTNQNLFDIIIGNDNECKYSDISNIELKAEKLIDTANKKGGSDNITAIIISYTEK